MQETVILSQVRISYHPTELQARWGKARTTTRLLLSTAHKPNVQKSQWKSRLHLMISIRQLQYLYLELGSVFWPKNDRPQLLSTCARYQISKRWSAYFHIGATDLNSKTVSLNSVCWVSWNKLQQIFVLQGIFLEAALVVLHQVAHEVHSHRFRVSSRWNGWFFHLDRPMKLGKQPTNTNSNSYFS